MPAHKYVAKSGMERSVLDPVWVAFLVGHIHMVVCWRTAALDIAHSRWNVVDGMGH